MRCVEEFSLMFRDVEGSWVFERRRWILYKLESEGAENLSRVYGDEACERA